MTGAKDWKGWCSRMSPLRDARRRCRAAVRQRLGQAGLEGRELEVGPVDLVGHRHQPHQVHDAGHAVEVVASEAELLQQEFGHHLGAVVGDFQAHGVAEMALRQLALQRGAQVLDFLVVDEQVGVARDAELVAAEHVHAGEQLADVAMQDRRQEDEAVVDAGELPRQLDHARQGARRLDDGGAAELRPKASLPSSSTAKFRLLLSTRGKGWAGSSPIGVSTGITSRKKKSRIQLALLGASRCCACRSAMPSSASAGRIDVVEQGVLLGDQRVGLQR